ncbi:uncharacterized protein LOC123884591 isoform X3 [Trifolium pratense]|uniref:Uncharacterized protein n=1 Tax=Trifolium pratense TaxID=57577 RepID=A0ACB0KZ08_TRIPR|nr:uncharacterized protein LOC123884591 isoform X3 [Trifolium pratense]CAJ2662370.1 unnamed protein product [Trifolium pratense]
MLPRLSLVRRTHIWLLSIGKVRPWGDSKCNIDASFASHLNRVGIGICICDELGQFVLSKRKLIALLCGVDVGEPLEPVTVSGLIQAGALQNATVAELDAAQTYLAAVDVGKHVTDSGLIQAGALQNAIVAELDAAQTYSAAVNVGMSLDIPKLSLCPSVSLN